MEPRLDFERLLLQKHFHFIKHNLQEMAWLALSVKPFGFRKYTRQQKKENNHISLFVLDIKKYGHVVFINSLVPDGHIAPIKPIKFIRWTVKIDLQHASALYFFS